MLKEHGTFTTPALQKMKKLDSFLREVMRTHPIGWSMWSPFPPPPDSHTYIIADVFIKPPLPGKS